MPHVIMVLGATAGCGKSTVVRGLCRIMAQDGRCVVPFAGECFVDVPHSLPDGKLMSPDQALQAVAAGLDPDMRMNPVMLRALEGGLGLILCGRERGTLAPAVYEGMKDTFLPDIMRFVNQLAVEHENVLVEGAQAVVRHGKQAGRDLGNLAFAQMVGASALLMVDARAGDVDQQVHDVIDPLPYEDRSRIKGVIVNWYDGGRSLGDLRQVAGKHVVGAMGAVAHPEDGDALAGALRASLDLPAIAAIFEQSRYA